MIKFRLMIWLVISFSATYNAANGSSPKKETEDTVTKLDKEQFENHKKLYYANDTANSDLRIKRQAKTPPTPPETSTQKPFCQWRDWGAWAKCDCQTGSQSRIRNPKLVPNGNCVIDGCSEDLRACTPLQCPIDCVYTAWSSWGRCKGKCGKGTRKRTRSIKVPALYGGKKCKKFEEKEHCHVKGGKCSNECELGSWADWSECRSHDYNPCQCSSGDYGYEIDGFQVRERIIYGEGHNCPNKKEVLGCRLSCCN